VEAENSTGTRRRWGRRGGEAAASGTTPAGPRPHPAVISLLHHFPPLLHRFLTTHHPELADSATPALSTTAALARVSKFIEAIASPSSVPSASHLKHAKTFLRYRGSSCGPHTGASS